MSTRVKVSPTMEPGGSSVPSWPWISMENPRPETRIRTNLNRERKPNLFMAKEKLILVNCINTDSTTYSPISIKQRHKTPIEIRERETTALEAGEERSSRGVRTSLLEQPASIIRQTRTENLSMLKSFYITNIQVFRPNANRPFIPLPASRRRCMPHRYRHDRCLPRVSLPFLFFCCI